MGFGSYDESEQGNQELNEEDLDEDEIERVQDSEHEGKCEFEMESTDDALDMLKDIQEDEENDD